MSNTVIYKHLQKGPAAAKKSQEKVLQMRTTSVPQSRPPLRLAKSPTTTWSKTAQAPEDELLATERGELQASPPSNVARRGIINQCLMSTLLSSIH